MTVRVWIDGNEVAAESASVSIFDHGFLFGDSVYEVFRGVGEQLLRGEGHLARLERSAARLKLQLPLSRAEQEAEILAAVRAGGHENTYVRLIVTRGVGEVNILPDSCARTTRILILKPLAPFPERYLEEGMRLAIVGVVRNPSSAIDPAVKSGNYLNSVMALVEAKERGADDAVMCNTEGHVAECSTSNLFFVRDGVLCTPALECGILGGVTRQALLETYAPAAGVPTRPGAFTPEELYSADEAFQTSTLKGVMPVCSVDDKTIGSGRPGPITLRLRELVQSDIERLRG